MWIERIELSNFKAYENQSFEFPKPAAGKNIVLIGGMNGHGKTTLLEALYLCLYGEDATHHLARAGLRDNAYAKFLQGALHGSAHTKRASAMRVSIRLMVLDDYGFDIRRTWFFDPKGSFQSQEVGLYEVRNGIPRPLDASEQLMNVLNQHVVPAHLAPFFFFDGEEVKKLADQDRSEWVKQGMESLMGAVLVRQLRERLSQYQNNRRQGATAVDKAELDRMLAEVRAKESERDSLTDELHNCLEDIQLKTKDIESLQERLITIGAGGGNIKSVEDIIREEGEKKRELDECEKTLEKLLGDRLPFHLALPDLHESLRKGLQAERRLIEWENRKRGLEPEKNRFAERFLASERVIVRLKELENRRIQLQGVEDDGTLKKINEDLQTTQAALNDLNRRRGDLERQLTSLESTINQAKADYERENSKYLLAEPAQSVARKAARVMSLIDELLPQLFEQKTHDLSVRVTKRFKSLAHRNWIDRIEIGSDGSAQLYAANGQHVKFDRSAGENQIFATALFAGLADLSGYHIPLVVDTPMARLDSQHRKNLLEYWHDDPDRQVILLSQDKEVDSELAATLAPYLTKTYLLESIRVDEGVYRTAAKENAYFGGRV